MCKALPVKSEYPTPSRYRQYTFGMIYPAVLGAFIFGLIENAEDAALLSLSSSKNWLSILIIVFFCIQYVELNHNREGNEFGFGNAIKHYAILAGLIQMMVSLGAISHLIELSQIQWKAERLFWGSFGVILMLIFISRCCAACKQEGLSCFGQVKSALAVLGSIYCLIEFSINSDWECRSVVLLAILLIIYICVLCLQGDDPDVIVLGDQRCRG